MSLEEMMEEKSCEVVEGSHTAGGGGGENMPRGDETREALGKNICVISCWLV